MEAIIQELDRLREENKALRKEVEKLTIQVKGAERAIALAGSFYHILDKHPNDKTVSHEEYLKGILALGMPIYNRFYIVDELEREFRRNTREKAEMSCVLLAADSDCEDDCLCMMAELLHKHLRSEDVLGLWEGSTFIMVLSRTECETAVALADYLRSLIVDAVGVPELTMSAGVTDLKAGAPQTAAEMLDYAADALRLAREMGGNRSLIYNRMPL